MSYDSAYKILIQYNNWRRGKNVEMPEPEDTDKAIAVALELLESAVNDCIDYK